jgi:hypothetical protein
VINDFITLLLSDPSVCFLFSFLFMTNRKESSTCGVVDQFASESNLSFTIR